MRRLLAAVGCTLGCAALLTAYPAPNRLPDRPGSQAADSYVRQLSIIISQVRLRYVQPVSEQDLVRAALTGLYEAARLPVPETLATNVQSAAATGELGRYAVQVRQSLEKIPALDGHEAILVSCRALARTLDPYSAVVVGEDLRRANGVDQQQGIGIELVDNAGVGPLFVKSVLPGSPAQKAGIRPGDEITHIGGKEVRGMTSAQVLAGFQKGIPGFGMELDTPVSGPIPVELTLRRPGTTAAWQVKPDAQIFRAETVLGTMRAEDNSWDYWLDRKRRIAHVRIAALGSNTGNELAQVVSELQEAGLRGLILDLRWCPGGYLGESAAAAALFLGDCALATIINRDEKGEKQEKVYASSEYRSALCLKVPVLVLVNGQTSGGAELIAAALQDHKRARIAGQRTLGKASVQTALDIGVPGAGMKLTSGSFLRPSRKNLHRYPDSKPGSDWGVRPDPGLGFPVSIELGQQLRDWWLLQTLRPGSSRERLPLDDPALDPQRQEAFQALLKEVDKVQTITMPQGERARTSEAEEPPGD